MNSEHVKTLLRKSAYNNTDEMDMSKEFFYTINSKFYSIIGNFSGRILNIETIQQFNESIACKSFEQVIKGNYEIIIDNIHFPIETQLWSNSGLLSARRM